MNETGRADHTTMNALEALRWHWDEAYEIEANDDEWRARRRDGLRGWMTALSAEVLRALIVEDYTDQPVSRPQG